MFFTKKKFSDLSTNGYALMLFSSVMFAIMALLGKILMSRENIPSFEVIFFRTFINVVIVLVYAGFAGVSLKGKDKKLLIFRSVIGFFAFAAYFGALSKINLSDAVILNYTAPIFVAIISFVYFKEKPSISNLVSITIAIVGAALVIKPSFSFFNFGGLIGLLSGFLVALVYISVQKLGEKESSLTIIFYWAFTTTVLSFPIMLFNFIPPTTIGWVYLACMGIVGTLGQFAMTRGYKYITAQKGSLTSLTNIIFSGLLAYFVLGEAMDAYTILGGFMILCGSVGVLLLKPLFFHVKNGKPV